MNRIRRFVRKNGQVIDGQVEEAGNEQAQANNVVVEGVAAGCNVVAGNPGNNAPTLRLAPFMLVFILFVFVAILVFGGIYRMGRGAKNEPARIAKNSGSVKADAFQSPIPQEVPYRDNSQNPVKERSQEAPIAQRPQVKADNNIPTWESIGKMTPPADKEQETSPVTNSPPSEMNQTHEAQGMMEEPVVDYQASVKEMERVLKDKWDQMSELMDDLEGGSADGQ